MPNILGAGRKRAGRSHDVGFTTVELIVAIVVSSFLIVAIVAFIVTLTRQYSVSVARNTLTNELSTAVNRIDTDVKSSDKIIATSPLDPAGPLNNSSRWSLSTSTNLDTVVLTTLARTSSGSSLSGGYPGQADIIVYYVRDGSLYRRLVAVDHPNNRYDTLTCPGTPSGGCPADEVLLEGVTAFNVTMLGSSGPTTNPAQAKSLKFTIRGEVTEAGQTITQTSTISSSLLGTATTSS